MPKKVVQTLVLLLLLVVFPLVSWMYLRKGLDYRLDTLGQLNPKSSLPINSNYLKSGAFQILYSDADPSYVNRLIPIADHFNDQGDLVQFHAFEVKNSSADVDSLRKVWLTKYEEGEFDQASFLIDTNNQILQCYRIQNDDDLSSLAEHIAFLLPMDPEKDFEYRPERER